jgi:hypothetical protein
VKLAVFWVAVACGVVSKAKLSLCFNWSPRYEGVLGCGGMAPRILDLCSRWRWVVSFTTRPLYPQGKCRRHPLDRRQIIKLYIQWLLVMVFRVVMTCSNEARHQSFRGSCSLDLMLKMEVSVSSETITAHHTTIRHQNSTDKLNHSSGNLKSWTINL